MKATALLEDKKKIQREALIVQQRCPPERSRQSIQVKINLNQVSITFQV
jgi:hypothetical protein